MNLKMRLRLWRMILRNRLEAAFFSGAREKMAADYRRIRGREADFDNPSDFSEYIMAGIIERRNDRYAHLADKVRVRDYVDSKGLGHLLPELLGVWKRASQIDFDALSDRFVIKTNHGSRYTLVCSDKSTFQTDRAKLTLDIWRRLKFNPIETHYSLIKPRILAEEFIDDGSGGLPADYKFMCFHGEPLFVFVCTNRDPKTDSVKPYLFDEEWHYLPHYIVDDPGDGNSISKPTNFEQMKDYARTLSQDFEFVRVDLYDAGDMVYFGELTFTPGMGRLDDFTDAALRDMYAKL